MKIYQSINRVPGGMMVVPLFIGMVINTFAPNLLRIGGFTQALTGVGYPTLLGMYLFTVGTKMTLRAAPRMMFRGFGIMAAKVGTATALALLVDRAFGGNLLGLSTLAVMVAMSDTNGGMFLALTSVMGDKDDAGDDAEDAHDRHGPAVAPRVQDMIDDGSTMSFEWIPGRPALPRQCSVR